MKFCAKCGKQLQDDAVCDCTATATVRRHSSNTFLDRLKAWPTVTRHMLGITCLCIVGVIVLTAIGAAATAPVNTVKGYFIAKSRGDWGGVYDYYPLSKHESAFINRDTFIALNKGTWVTDYTVDESMGLNYWVEYTQGSATRLTENVFCKGSTDGGSSLTDMTSARRTP